MVCTDVTVPKMGKEVKGSAPTPFPQSALGGQDSSQAHMARVRSQISDQVTDVENGLSAVVDENVRPF